MANIGDRRRLLEDNQQTCKNATGGVSSERARASMGEPTGRRVRFLQRFIENGQSHVHFILFVAEVVGPERPANDAHTPFSSASSCRVLPRRSEIFDGVGVGVRVQALEDVRKGGLAVGQTVRLDGRLVLFARTEIIEKVIQTVAGEGELRREIAHVHQRIARDGEQVADQLRVALGQRDDLKEEV